MTNVNLHSLIGLSERFFTALVLGIGLLTLGAIAPPPAPQEKVPPPAPQEEVPTMAPLAIASEYGTLSKTLNTSDILWETAKENAADILTVKFYTPTGSCDGFNTQERSIVADKAVSQIIHFLLADQTPHLVGFELAGYRTQLGSKDGDVTIDFRRSPDAQRHFISLSICEQLVLFGSLRKTLLENPALNINTVNFTERGRLIEL